MVPASFGRKNFFIYESCVALLCSSIAISECLVVVAFRIC